MTFHTLTNTLLSLGLTITIATLVWIRVHKIGRSLDVSDETKKRITIKAAIGLFGWFAAVLILANLEWFHVSSSFLSPLVPLFFLVPVYYGYKKMKTSATVQKIIDKITQPWVIILQTFRIGGVIFLALYVQGQLPAAFALPAGIGDVFIGVTAPIVAYIAWKKTRGYRKIILGWNIIGIIDLLIAIGVGITLSVGPTFSPGFVGPTTEIMTLFPLVLVPAFAVPLDFLLHLVSLRLLAKEKKDSEKKVRSSPKLSQSL